MTFVGLTGRIDSAVEKERLPGSNRVERSGKIYRNAVKDRSFLKT
jgi:hypothetical protein